MTNDINNAHLPNQIKLILSREEKSEIKKENYKPGQNYQAPQNGREGRKSNYQGNGSSQAPTNHLPQTGTIIRGSNPPASKGNNPTPQPQPQQESMLSINREFDPLKDKLRKDANSWMKGKEKEANQNPEIKIEKELKFNLNLLSPDNYHKVKLEILERARKRYEKNKDRADAELFTIKINTFQPKAMQYFGGPNYPKGLGRAQIYKHLRQALL